MAIPDLLQVPDNNSQVGLDNLVLPDPAKNTQYTPAPQVNGEKEAWGDFLSKPSSLTAKLQPEYFDWEKSNADRYVQSRHLKDVGFDPHIGMESVNGKSYDVNELRYGAVQTWGDVMGNAVGGAFHLAVGSFEQSVASWGHTINALFGWNSDNTFKERLLGTSEELLANNKKQEDIMNKYAIYHTPYGDSHLFSKEFIGDVTQQMGFGIGMGAEILAESLLTGGIGKAFSLFSKGVEVAAATEKAVKVGEETAALSRTAADVAPSIGSTAEHINDLRKVSDISTDRDLMTKIWQGAKNLIPGAEAVQDWQRASKAGVVGWDLYKAGIPGVIKTFSMANAAKAESMMEASNTYGQLYGDLTAKYQRDHDGQMPIGADLEKIKSASYGAATDNFIVNTGLLMTMNQLEFSNMFSKFGSAKRLIRQAAEEGVDKNIVTIAGKEGKRIAYSKATGLLAGARTANEIRKDFGLGTALWYGTKHYLGSQAAKFEIAEGVQEVLQNTSDQTFRDYYTNLYDGGKDIHGRSFFSDVHGADFGKGISSQNLGLDEQSRRTMWESNGGWKTFLMGAVTGLFMSPLSSATMYANRKGYGLINKEYKSKLDENKALQAENRDILNSFFQDPAKMLNEHIANTKVQGYGAQQMADAAAVGDKYSYTNAKQDMFTKAVATAIKTDNYDSFIDHLQEFPSKFKDDTEFEQAFPTLKSTGMTATDMRQYIHAMADDITAYHNNWENLKDKYEDMVAPELHKGQTAKDARVQRLALDNAIETLATTDYHATQAIKRAGEIKDTMGSLPGIGTSVNNAFDIMGNLHQAAAQIQLLHEEIATYDALGRDPSIKDMKENAREQLKHLTAWTEAHSEQGDIKSKQAAFNGYVQAKNKEFNNNSPIVTDRRVLDDAFTNLGDYMQLNRDHGQYIDALNVLSTLKSFKDTHQRHVAGIYYFERLATQQILKEFQQRADIKTGTTVGDVPPPEDAGEGDQGSSTPVTKEDIINHYNEEENGNVTTYLAKHPELSKELEILDGQRHDMGEDLYNKHLSEILDKHFKEQEDKKNSTITAEKRKALQTAWAKELKDNRDKYPDTGSKPLSEADKVIKKQNEDAINAKYKKLLGQDSEPDKEYIPVEGKKLQILHSQITVGPHREGNETDKEADVKLSHILASAGSLQDRLSLVVTLGPNTGAQTSTIVNSKGELNPNIISNGQDYSMQLVLDGQPIGYLTNSGVYTFVTARGLVSTQQLTKEEFKDFVEIPEKGDFNTLEAAYNKFQSDANNAAAIQAAIEGKLDENGEGTLSGAELADILSVSPRVQMDYVESGKGEVGPPLSAISQYLHRNEQGKLIVVSNRISEDGTRLWISGTESDIEGIGLPDIENLGTYSVLLNVAGTPQWVQVTPAQYTEAQLQPQLTTLNNLLAEKEPTEQQIREIKNIINDIAILLPEVYSHEGQAGKRKKTEHPENKWTIRLVYVEPSPDKPGHLVVSTNKKGATIRTLENRDISTPEKLATAVQTVLRQRNTFPGLNITANNFHHNIPHEASESDILGTTSSVRTGVYKSISLTYGLPQDQSSLPQQVQPGISKEAILTPLPKKNEQATKAVEDADFDALEDTRNIESRDRKVGERKVIIPTEGFDEHSVENIDRFHEWCSKNLPDTISVEDMGILRSNLQDTNTTVGQFITRLSALRPGLEGVIQVYKNSPFKYHEAFHGVFRMLLTDQKIAQLLDIARKEHPVTEHGLQALRDLHEDYRKMSREELEQAYLVEYMADKFDAWMLDKKVPTSHIIKGFFAQILDWIKALWDKLTGSQLQGLFQDINRGKFSHAGLVQNRFSGIASEDINPDKKVIQIGTRVLPDGKKVPKYLPQDISEQIVSGIVNLFYKEVGDSTEYNKSQVLNKILKVYHDTYDTKLPMYKSRANSITDLGERRRWMDNLIDLKNTFRDPAALTSLKEAVDFHLNLMGYRQELDDQEMEAVTDEYGPNNTENAHKNVAPLSDYGSLSKFLRGYIGSTTYQLDKDIFGNKELSGGSPIYANVSANKVYNGLLKVLTNYSDESKLLDRLVEYTKHSGNPETVQFINRLLDEVDFNYDTRTPGKNSELLMQVIKGFNQYESPYLFTKITGTSYETSYANSRNAASTQFTAWRDNSLQLKKVGSKAVNDLVAHLTKDSGADKSIGNIAAENESTRLADQLQKQTGIVLTPMYLKYLILSAKAADKLTEDQQKFIDLYSNVETVTAAELRANLLNVLSSGNDIYSREAEQGDKVSGSSPRSLLLKLATGNAQFDEAVNTMSFKNADGEDVYAHGFPNYDFMAISDLNDPAQVQRLLNDPGRQSFLLTDPKFQVLMDRNQVRVKQIDGIRQESDRDDPGITFRKFNTREYLATLLGLYDVRKQPDTKVVTGSEHFYKVPVSIRTIESKSSIHMVSTPVIAAIDKGKLTRRALDIMTQWVQQEHVRIQQVKQEIADGTGHKEGYHTSVKGKEPRGLHFFTTADMLGPLAAELETAESIEDRKADIEAQLQSYWMQQVQDTLDYMQKEGLIEIKDGKVTNLLVPNYLFRGMGELNSKMNMSQSDPVHNLAQVILNDAINTVGINQILFGDEAQSFSDAIDQVKRMAGANAQGPNMVVPFINKELGIDHILTNIHHITYRSDKVISDTGSGAEIDSDDGQMYCTEKGLRYMLFGFGKLNKVQAGILDNLRNGKRVTASEFFDNGGLKDRGAFNSYKLVYFDGQTYLKCSAIPLFRDNPDYAEDAHILRMKMEEYEDRNNTVVFAHPVSVSKAMKNNIAGSIHDIEDQHFNELPAKYMRQQLENPSNKLTITDPTQIKQLITSEQVDSTPVVLMGAHTTIGQVKAAYYTDVAQRIANSYSTNVNSIFNLQNGLIELGKSRDAGQATPMLGRFMDMMKENLMSTGADQQTLGFLETQNGQPVYNLNFPSTLEKFTQIFLNYFSKGVTAEKVPGLSLALVSGALGLGKRYKQVISLDPATGQPRQWEVITDAEYRKNPSKYSQGHRYSDPKARTFEGLAVGDYYLDDLRHNVAEYDRHGNITGRFSEYIRPAHFREEMSGISDALQQGLGIRIPSDDKHSMMSLRMVDTMPIQYGSVGIFPHELIEVSGADFDIDKLYVQLQDTYSTKGTRKAYGTAKTADRQFGEYIDWTYENNRNIRSEVNKRFQEDADVKDIIKTLSKDKDRQEELLQQIIDSNRLIDYDQPLTTTKGILEDGHSHIYHDAEGNARMSPVSHFGNVLAEKRNYNNLYLSAIRTLVPAYKESGKEIEDAEVLLQDIKTGLKLQVMRENKLPGTTEEYTAAGGADKLNNGVLNNRILAQRIAMQSNEHIAGEIANSPTSTDPLTALADELQEQGLILQESIGNVNTLLGKVRSYGANMEGARNIGSTANAIQVYSMLNNTHIQLSESARITIDGHTYTGFSNTRELVPVEHIPVLYTKGKNKGEIRGYMIGGQEFTKRDFDKGYFPTGEYKGTRIFSSLSTLLNAMTDNAKERLASRLGLNITALGYVSNMVSLGVPLRTSVLLMLQPSVKDYFQQLSALSGGLKTVAEQRQSRARLLSDILKGTGADSSVTTVDKMVKDITSGDYNIDSLALLQQVDTISKTLMNVSKIQKLSQGMPSSWEDIDKLNKNLDDLAIVYDNGNYVAKMHNEDSRGEELPVDVRDLLLHDQPIVVRNLQVLAQVQQLAQKVFLEKTSLFRRVTDIATGNMRDMYPAEAEEYNKQLKFDTISYFSILAHIKWLKDNAQDTSTLNHAMIYLAAKEQQMPEYKDIVDIISTLKEKLTGNNENYLVSKFLMVTPADTQKQGINTAEANTWARINELQQDKLVTAFSLLYSNSYTDEQGNIIETHDMAQAMFNYLLVKDGGQFKAGTFIKFMPTYMFKDIMDRTGEVNEFLSKGTWDEVQAQKLFGVSSHQLLNIFMSSYGTHIGNESFLQSIVAPIGQLKGPVMRDGQGNITVDIFRDVLPSMSKDQKKEQIEANKDIIKAHRFTIDKDKGLELPYSIKVGGLLYTLTQIGRDKGSQTTDFLDRNETVPHGTSATYTKAQWTGAKDTFKSAGVFGPVPQTPASNTRSRTQETGEPEGYDEASYYTDEQQGDYPEQYEQPTQTPVEKLQSQGYTFTTQNGQKGVMKNGIFTAIPAGTRLEDIPSVVARNIQPDVVSSRPMQQELFALSAGPVKNHAMSYKMPAKDNLTGRDTSTVELAEQGIRTGTTRSYALGKVGDIITFENRPQQYRITGTEQLTQQKVSDPKWIQQWSQKEQWTPEYFKKVLGGSIVHIGSWQTSFEKVTQSAQPVVPSQQMGDIESLYKNFPTISSIGTQQQYSQYISNIFPNSKIKDIVYHGNRSDEQFDTFNEAGAIFFANKEYADTFKKKHLIAAIVNITNLKDIKDAKFNRKRNKPGYTSPEGTQDARDILSNDKNIDGLRGVDYSDTNNQTIVVRNPQQVHILGSKQDIEGFKKFVSSQSSTLTRQQALASVHLEERTINGEYSSYYVSNVPHPVHKNSVIGGFSKKEAEAAINKHYDSIQDIPQQMTSEQWKNELNTLYAGDVSKIKEAITYRNEKRVQGISDTDILKKIKECM